MNVLIIPEDFRYDQHLLRPLFKKLFESIGRARTKVTVCQEPLLRGVNEALKSQRIQEVIDQHNGMTDVFVLCVDRDGDLGRRVRLDQIEDEFRNDRIFLAENAWEEIETWALAGLNLPGEWRWADVRAAVDVKERYFKVLAEERGVADGPGGGRKALGEEAARRIDAIRLKCPDDFDALAQRIETEVAT